MTGRIIEIVIGCACLIIAAMNRTFYWGGFGASRRSDAPRIPPWLGVGLFSYALGRAVEDTAYFDRKNLGGEGLG